MNIKRLFNFTIVVFAYLIMCAYKNPCTAQNLDSLEVITQFFKAHGGESNWRTVESLQHKYTYKEYLNNLENSIQDVEWIVIGDKYQRVISTDLTKGYTRTLCLNDTIFWTKSRYGYIEILPEEHAKYYKDTMGFGNPLFFLKKDVDISYLKDTILNDKMYYCFKVKRAGWSNGTIYYIDDETFLITYARNESSKSYFTKFSDYRLINNIMFPFVQESLNNLVKLTSTAFTISIEINGDIDYSIFQIPK